MLEFKTLGADVSILTEYIDKSHTPCCDISLGIRFMWRNDFLVAYAIYNDTLIMKESSPDYTDVFYYPIGKDVLGALEQIEEYCKVNCIPLTFGCLNNKVADQLQARYFETERSFEREWCDYIYTAEQFKTYAGKKLSGQRNHVNKFKKLYPDYKFKTLTQEDFPRVKDFLLEFTSRAGEMTWSEEVELKTVFDLVENMYSINQVGGYLEVDGKMIAFSVGEVVGETMIVHIEKALTEYQGVYPTMAKEFANAFIGDGVKYINREEDCGDIGLRTSKMQYKPIELREKVVLTAKTLFDRIVPNVTITAGRVDLTEIYQTDKEIYAKLYLDDDLNKWWGYDYKEDLGDFSPTPEYFYQFQNGLKVKKEEFSFAVRERGKMIGELVLHNFDHFGGVEMGFRFFTEYQGKGYAIESASVLKEYVFNSLGAKKLKSRCFKQNIPSRKLIEKLGLKLVREDTTHYYFES